MAAHDGSHRSPSNHGTGPAGATPDDARLEAAAAELLAHHRESPRVALGSKACALVDTAGAVHRGVSIVMPSGMGFCAEHAAAAAVVATGATGVARLVTVHHDRDGRLERLAPCGRCREFLWQLDPANRDAEVLLVHGPVTLAELLPHPWVPEPHRPEPHRPEPPRC